MGSTRGFSDVMPVALGLFLAGVAVHSSAGFLVYRDWMGTLTVDHGLVCALLAAFARAVLTRVPLVGGILAPIAWFAVLRFRYPGGWLRATGHGLAALAAATVLIAAVSRLGACGVRPSEAPGRDPSSGQRSVSWAIPSPAVAGRSDGLLKRRRRTSPRDRSNEKRFQARPA